jgi:hypothetical protein
MPDEPIHHRFRKVSGQRLPSHGGGVRIVQRPGGHDASGLSLPPGAGPESVVGRFGEEAPAKPGARRRVRFIAEIAPQSVESPRRRLQLRGPGGVWPLARPVAREPGRRIKARSAAKKRKRMSHHRGDGADAAGALVDPRNMLVPGPATIASTTRPSTAPARDESRPQATMAKRTMPPCGPKSPRAREPQTARRTVSGKAAATIPLTWKRPPIQLPRSSDHHAGVQPTALMVRIAVKQMEVLPVSLPLQILRGDEAEGGRIDAVAKAAPVAWPVVEHMAKVRVGGG